MAGKEPKAEMHYAFASFVKVLENKDMVDLRSWLSNLVDFPLYVPPGLKERLIVS